MKIVHLSHSGFALEDDNVLVLFDPITPINNLGNFNTTYIFSSHSHGDHFKPEIFNMYYHLDNYYFIFSDDIGMKIKEENIKNLHIVKPYDIRNINDIKLRVYGATDLGNSYMVELNNKTYFHSGDLNWWHWNEKMSKEQLAEEERIFKYEINKVKESNIKIDFAFVPVDPRLKEYGYLAINYFVETIKPKYIIPMHSFGEYNYYNNLEQKVKLGDTTLITVSGENQEIFSI